MENLRAFEVIYKPYTEKKAAKITIRDLRNNKKIIIMNEIIIWHNNFIVNMNGHEHRIKADGSIVKIVRSGK